ncbi:type II toxin-antitoxin system RelE/ParE family toxin [Escherichia coli]|uniref:Type II toxin-antitoxin system RelE/ParE family toxin n=1 Tax=Escherichia coli TaxID=562 RepID=A0AAN3PXQ6_ECOLX|nr:MULTISPECIES: type II toxin-antitoxin system RelE/ParE family toxin [Escherichia]EER2597160.1 type II toxin-antitoxin system RelE/ParE family toxin [Escherichia coli]EGO5105098.1 type II toxin-antitoxin system RelE/ParE family toxin [Escherichia coli]EGO5208897.1 type II toxin-antitoxin system RelE/ParE family toxin [Escherichia coli]EGO6651791.1 type II toxin-antitoxin system RelE/ParE family toxin [Escherichia coli]EGO6678380.1 type II toxin-antitoxin system RelE/ParE family toxin [Escher
MNYELAFDPRALKEWQKLGVKVREQFKKKLGDVLKRRRNPSAKLRDLPDCYKIKLRTLGYRLVYQVNDKELLVLVIAIGKRENSAVYEDATKRLDE